MRQACRKMHFPLQGIVSKKVADLRPQSMRIGWNSLLVLLGQHVAVPMPQNVNSEDVTWSAKGMSFFISASDRGDLLSAGCCCRRLDRAPDEPLAGPQPAATFSRELCAAICILCL